jgi:hypothetical protein
VERAGALFFELADAIKQASENILADIDPASGRQTEAEANLPRLGELLEQHGSGLKQYLLPLKKAGLTMERLLSLATSVPSPDPAADSVTEEAEAEDAEAALRQALRDAGVKKIGHREQIVRAVLAAAAQLSQFTP